MPIKRNRRRADQAAGRRRRRARRNPRTASKFIREEMRQRGTRSRKQAIAIGLSRARAAGIKVPARRARRRNPPASSPAGAGRLIYPRVLYVVAQKDPRGRDNHPCDAACRRANHTYKHSYAGRRPPVAAYGRQNDVVLSDFKGW